MHSRVSCSWQDMWGDKNTWRRVEDRWRTALDEEGIAAFHSTDCENGYGDFSEICRERRQDLQLKFLSIIANSDLRGYSSCILARHFSLFEERIKRRRGKYWYPYFLVFQHLLEVCGRDAEKHFAGRVSFVFDRQKEFSGRAFEICNAILDGRSTNVGRTHYRTRFGGVTFENKQEVLELQVADALAYESYRYATEVEYGINSPRWQFDVIRPTVNAAHVFTKKSILELIDHNLW